jgi:hypothetical protein
MISGWVQELNYKAAVNSGVVEAAMEEEEYRKQAGAAVSWRRE